MNVFLVDFGIDFEVIVLMDYGIIVFCDVSFGDGDMFKIDFLYFGNVLDYCFLVVGLYNILVKCYNCLGYEEYIFIYDVDIVIIDVLVVSDK